MKKLWNTVFVAIASISLFTANAEARELEASNADASASALNTAALLADVHTLASPAFAGRRTGSDGSRLAQAYITSRFKDSGLKPFGITYAIPFALSNGDKFMAMVKKAAPTIAEFFEDVARGGRKTPLDHPSAVNLIGHIPGSVHPERYMVVSAHYDHLGVRDGATYLGADDNASGVAAMLAVAAHFKRHPPRNTIVFAAFDAEELGKGGSKAFVAAAPFQIGQVALNLNFDMVSRNDHNEIFAAGTSYTPVLKALVARAAATSRVKVRLGHDSEIPNAPPGDDWTGGSDHAAFHELGIPFLYFGVEDHADYHKPSDSFEKIQPIFFAEVTRLLVSVADILDQNLDMIK